MKLKQKGKNRSAFFRGEINKYIWVDIGSSFLSSELIAAFLFAQLEHIDEIQRKRKSIWNLYYERLKPFEDKGMILLPKIPDYAINNAHLFYIILKERTDLICFLDQKSILAVFHYILLHRSPFYQKYYDRVELKYADFYSERLLRLPLFYELKNEELQYITNCIKKFYESVSQKLVFYKDYEKNSKNICNSGF